MPDPIKVVGLLSLAQIEEVQARVRKVPAGTAPEIYVNSPGGDYTEATLTLAEEISQREPITTARAALSGAAYIFLAGKKRGISSKGEIHLYSPILFIPVDAIDERRRIPKDVYQRGKALRVRMEKFLRENVGISEELLLQIFTGGGRVFTPEEAVEYGLAHHIVD